MTDLQAFLAVIAGATGGSVAGAAAVKSVREVAAEFVRARSHVSRYSQARQGVSSAKRILGFRQSGTLAYRSDNVHILYQGQSTIHPDNRRALIAAAGDEFFGAERSGLLEVHDSVRAGLSDSLVLIGGPTSEGVSRIVFGYVPDAPGGDSLSLGNAPVDLPYRQVLSYNEVSELAAAHRYVEGRGAVARRNWRIETDHEAFIPELGESGWLRTDYLLITRLRNFLTSDGYAQGHSIVSVAGTHGVATQALGMVLKDNSILRAVSESVGERACPSFQFLVRIVEIDHDPRLGSRPRKIELVGRPILLDDNPQRWRAAQEVVKKNLER